MSIERTPPLAATIVEPYRSLFSVRRYRPGDIWSAEGHHPIGLPRRSGETGKFSQWI